METEVKKKIESGIDKINKMVIGLIVWRLLIWVSFDLFARLNGYSTFCAEKGVLYAKA